MSVEIISQQGIVACGVTLGVSGQPALGGVDFAVLLDLPILRHNELRAQRHDLGVAGTDDDWRDGTVEMGGGALRVPEAGTVGTVVLLTARIACSKPASAKAWCRSSKRLKRQCGATGSSVWRMWLSEGMRPTWNRERALFRPWVCSIFC